MKRTDRRRKQPSGWMQGYGGAPSLEATCEALEDRLREGSPRPFADAPRVHLDEELHLGAAEWWAL